MTGAAVLLTGAAVVTPDAVLPDAAVLVRDGRIAAVLDRGDSHPAAARRVELDGGYLIPGLIDLHVHGGDGASYDDGAEPIAKAVAAHRRQGTTTTMVSLITATENEMIGAIRGAAEAAARDPRIAGIHLEGPFLSPLHRGAHDPTRLKEPDLALFDRFVSVGGGLIRMITMAPERPGGLDLVRAAVTADVHVAVGHCDADYAQAMAAFDAGADIVTHAFNAMRPLHHRDPGVIAAARDAGVVLEVINDGVHLHDATVRFLHAAAPGRIAFVTDAMAAACSRDGHYRLGSLDVEVIDGVARLAEGGAIAGSTLTMGRAVRRAIVEVGLDIVDAVNAASLIPAQFLGLDGRVGAIRESLAADLVVMDADWAIRAVMLDGQWADERRP